MINILTLKFRPSAVSWVHQSSDIIHSLAISDLDSPTISIFDSKGNELIQTIEGIHFKPVVKIDVSQFINFLKYILLIQYNAKVDIAISVDTGGMIEFWSGSKGNFEFPKEKLDWDSKFETDLYEFAKMQSYPHCLKIAPDGKTFATYGADRFIRIFDMVTGKIVKTINESLQNYVDQGKENKLVLLSIKNN